MKCGLLFLVRVIKYGVVLNKVVILPKIDSCRTTQKFTLYKNTDFLKFSSLKNNIIHLHHHLHQKNQNLNLPMVLANNGLEQNRPLMTTIQLNY